MGREECIQFLKKYMKKLQSEYGITSLSLFGSTARGSQKPNSDIDLFVDTETPNPFLLMDAKEFLENESGSSVDIVRNHQNLNPKLKKRILKDGILIF
jgi:predicted nucleotidyltransferase